MYFDQKTYHLLRQLQHGLVYQAEKMNQLENTVQRMQQELIALQSQKPMNVEKIEYHFDQLKVETLEGTLNIGISPSGGRSIDELAVSGQTIGESLGTPVGTFPGTAQSQTQANSNGNFNHNSNGISTPAVNGNPDGNLNGNSSFPLPKAQTSLYQRVHRQLYQYANNELPERMRSLEMKYNNEIDHEYSQMLINDIKKQLDERINHYMKQLPADINANDVNNLENTIVDKMKKDINNALEQYFKNLFEKDEEPS